MPGVRRSVRLLPVAQDDYDEILFNTLAQFGPGQVGRYEQRVRDALTFISDYPESRPKVAERMSDLRMHTVGRHNLFFRFDASTVAITRILHVRRNVTLEIIDIE